MKKYYVIPAVLLNKITKVDLERLNIAEIPLNIAYKFTHDYVSIKDVAISVLPEGATFDTSLPIDFVRDFTDKTGFHPIGHMVMYYGEDCTYGKVVGITPEGIVALQIFTHMEERENV